MPVNPEEFSKALSAIRSAYGESSIRKGSDKPELVRIPTGSVQLDWATGGGVPIGRWSHFYGGYMSCKSLTAWMVVRNAQAMGLDCAFYNVENQFDPKWAVKHGVDINKLHVIDGTTIEGIGTKLETLLSSVHLHVIDSIGASVSEDELAGELTDWTPGIAARAWGKALRRANERFDDKENVIILINQTRDVFGRQGGEAPTGGRFLEYMSSLSLHFKRSSWLFPDKKGILQADGEKQNSMTKDVRPAGMEFQIRVAKSRVSPPLRPARMRLDFRTMTFDSVWDLVVGASYFDVVARSGSWYTLPDGKKKVQGEAGLREAIIADPDLAAQITAKIMEDA